jgi:ABC-type transporter Mla subunit MlaD
MVADLYIWNRISRYFRLILYAPKSLELLLDQVKQISNQTEQLKDRSSTIERLLNNEQLAIQQLLNNEQLAIQQLSGNIKSNIEQLSGNIKLNGAASLQIIRNQVLVLNEIHQLREDIHTEILMLEMRQAKKITPVNNAKPTDS